MVHGVKLILSVSLQHFVLDLAESRQRPTVDLEKGLLTYGVAAGIEVGEVAEKETCRVADAAIGLGEALDDLIGDPYVAGVVLGGDPEPKDLRAVTLDDLLSGDDVAL